MSPWWLLLIVPVTVVLSVAGCLLWLSLSIMRRL